MTELSDLTRKMLGTETTPACKMKGAETWGFFLFLLSVLKQHKAKLELGTTILAAARILEHRICKLRKCAAIMTDTEIQDTIYIYIYIYIMTTTLLPWPVCFAPQRLAVVLWGVMATPAKSGVRTQGTFGQRPACSPQGG